VKGHCQTCEDPEGRLLTPSGEIDPAKARITNAGCGPEDERA